MKRVLLLLPLWLVLAVGEPSIVHSCPTHGSAQPAHLSGEARGEGGHAHHGGAPAGGIPSSHRDCSCIGACTTVAPALVPTYPATLAVVVAARTPIRRAAADARPRPRSARLLPFPNGPPARRG